ncbi:hypothetical protein [uncultured Ligilactobacillus sp.]|uniref:hypothetical protein n=1 Tax=uncultured Ligilactobacillus sp. TaxID=2837633 RepID=UPI00272C4C93|nr:hypothetical protein [uncultured Ligilactobacillus sp.]
MSRYMNQVQYVEIMKYENLNESIAVKAYLRQAMMQTNIIRKLEIHAEAHEEQAPIFRKYIKEHDEKRVKAVWDAIAVAEEEKRQGWRFVEDGAKFLAYLEVKYNGDLKQATDVEKLQVQLTTLYDQMYRRRENGEMR